MKYTNSRSIQFTGGISASRLGAFTEVLPDHAVIRINKDTGGGTLTDPGGLVTIIAEWTDEDRKRVGLPLRPGTCDGCGNPIPVALCVCATCDHDNSTKPAPADPDEALAEAMYNMEHGDGEVGVWSNTSEFERDLYRDLARAAREHIEAEKSQMGAALYYGASARVRAEEAERRVDELEPALARSETERDEWKAKHAALRADVERERGNLAQAGSTYAILRLDHILDHDAERGEQA